MIPRNTNLDPAPPQFPPRSRVPRWLMLVGVVTMLSVMAMGYLSLRVVQRIRQFKRLSAQIQRDYQQLDVEYPFRPPGLPGPPSAERLDVYLKARSTLAAHIAPEVEARAQEILSQGEAASITDVAQLFGAFYEFLSRGTQAHLDSLREGQMGSSEFFWIHGYVIHAVLQAPGDDARRKWLESALTALEGGAAPVAAPSRRFESGEFRAELDRRYAGFPAMDSESIEGFEVAGDAMTCLDILGATERLHRGLGISPMPSGIAAGPGPAQSARSTEAHALGLQAS